MKTLYRYFLVLILILTPAFGEQRLSREEMAMLQAIQQRAEMVEREKQWKEPLEPVKDKKRAYRGSFTAPIWITVYSDFECPYCSVGATNIEQVRKKYGSKVAFQFKHLPMPFHSKALPAAQYFEALAFQKSEWAYQFHDRVFANQERLVKEGTKFLDEVAKGTGANMKAVHANLTMPEVTNRIEADRKEAAKFSIQGTPGFVVAGIAVKGAYPPEEFFAIIDKRLDEQKAKKRAVTSQ